MKKPGNVTALVPARRAARLISGRGAEFQKFEALLNNRSKRGRYGEFLIEGVRNINEAARNNWRVVSFLFSKGRELSGWAKGLLETVETEANYELAEGLLKELSRKDEASELMAVVKMKSDGAAEFQRLRRDAGFEADSLAGGGNVPSPTDTPDGRAPLLILFDRPSNKGNLGTLFRSCDALGADCLFVTGHGVDVYDPEVVGSTMGSFFNVPFRVMAGNAQIDGTVEGLRKKFPGLRVIGTTAHKKNPLWGLDLTVPVLFMIGNETDGLNRHLAGLCDELATIPMDAGSSASSFNVSCAATVMLYEAARQRAGHY